LPIDSHDAPIPRLIATSLILKGLEFQYNRLYSNQFSRLIKVYILRSLENNVLVSIEPNSIFDEIRLLNEGSNFS